MNRIPRKFAFVVPRFAEDIAGGAETLVGTLASHVAEQGDYVEIFTTCARDNRSWENHYQPGDDRAFGLRVKRFAVDERDLDSWVPLQIRLHEGLSLTVDEQLEWMTHSVNSSALYHHIAEVADQFDALFFAPYLFGTTFWGSLIRPEKSILIPCLHDESYAYTDIISSMFRQVRGALFNAVPEMHLAKKLYGEIAGGEVGMGFEMFNESKIASLNTYFSDSSPYLLYLGRKETGKNAQLLVDYFIEGKEAGHIDDGLKLVVAGGGDFSDLHRPEALNRSDIVDIGHVSEEDKQRLIKHALVLCQPSVNESFSIVLMEAWRLGTPVLVHADCSVTRWHVVESNGGLYFASARELAESLSRMLQDSELRESMAVSGKAYTAGRYSWPAVIDRFNRVTEEMLERRHLLEDVVQ